MLVAMLVLMLEATKCYSKPTCHNRTVGSRYSTQLYHTYLYVLYSSSSTRELSSLAAHLIPMIIVAKIIQNARCLS